MCKIISSSVFLSLVVACLLPSASFAQEDTGLCPENFNEGIVTTGFVDCFRETSSRSNRADAEILRLQREAECIAEPRGSLIRSEILVDNNDNFFGSLTCRIGRVIPPNTILCPDGSIEIVRAFDTLACQYFGSAAESMAGAMTALNADTAACVAAPPGGNVLTSSVRIGESADDDELFFFTDLACGFDIPAVDVFECPIGFDERSRTETELECERVDVGLADMAQVDEVNASIQSICVATTAGLGSVVDSQVDFDTSTNTFRSEVDCNILIPRFGDFVDGDVIRACDESCTEDIEQTRMCLNGGVVGGPGCTASDTQIVTVKCNTGFDRSSACPVLGIPSANIVPLLLLDDDD